MLGELHDPTAVGFCPRRLGRIGDWAQRYIDAGKLPGTMTLVARHGRPVYLDIRGYRDIENRLAYAPDSILRFYSMSKPVTAVAALMLLEEAVYHLDDPIAEYLPEFAEPSVLVATSGETIETEPARTPITVHHLFTHCAGFTYGLGNQTPVAALYREHGTDFHPDDGPLEEVVKRLAALPLEFHPGERWGYGVALDVLGRLVEIWSGERFDRFLQTRILEPLGMSDTGFTLRDADRERFAILYGRNNANGMKVLGTPADNPYSRAVSTYSGGAGLLSTLNDYFVFAEMLRRGGEFNGERLLGRKTVELMRANHLRSDLAAMGQATFSETNFHGVGFGLGVWVVLDPARAQVVTSPGEFGWGGAASTVFWIDPVEDLTVIFLTQLTPSDAYPLRKELKVLVAQALV